MLWSTLFNRLGKQPLRITQHEHIHAIIEGKHYRLDLKFDASGKPYLVPMQEKPKKPYDKILYYRVCRDEPEIMGSGSTASNEVICHSEQEAFTALKAGRNDLRRYVIRPDGQRETQWWSSIDQAWKRGLDETLPY